MRVTPLLFALAAVAACATSTTATTKTSASGPAEPTPEEKPTMNDRKTDGAGNQAGVETPESSFVPATFTAAQLTTWCDAALAHAATLRGALESGKPTTSALLDYNELMRVLDTPNGWAALLFQVSPDADVRAAADGCKQRLAKFGNDVVMSRAIYQSLAKEDHSSATDEARRAHRLILREFKRSGVDQDDAARDRLKAIFERMVLLGQEYQKNASADVRYVEIDSEARLAGMPEDWIAARRPKAGEKLRISTDYPDYIPLLTYCKDGELRKQLAIAFAARGYPQNEAIMAEVLTLRREYATLLGYPSWAAYNAEDKMVKTTETIEKFLIELEGIVRPRSAADTAELLARKQKDEPKTDGFAVWDRFYYLNVVREEKYGYDSQETRQYFP
ncbi:MAG: hypothetical protein IV100_34210, partial [Myxococcales bacterium]|nr:hypothetical protein [Myxococcales bacterium]